MVKAENQKRVATAAERLLASRIRLAREGKKRWAETETRLVERFRAMVDVDTTLLTEHADEVASVTESKARVTYDYESYFKDHPSEREILERGYQKVGSTSVRVTTTWHEPEPGPLHHGETTEEIEPPGEAAS